MSLILNLYHFGRFYKQNFIKTIVQSCNHSHKSGNMFMSTVLSLIIYNVLKKQIKGSQKKMQQLHLESGLSVFYVNYLRICDKGYKFATK